ncbi:SpoIIE family protein phosphatase [Pistricoccus aurantiacus]|uniref:SpoIIE family protein phosphatase n=1 Tax=Pistricoccus aurantiacus TaxID=1883414 RepID=A0A5B8SX97_9GAMM|nr:PP2C family protein-serine/threonine phosphatase [Pistricoccus aurantiacus]QEA39543.1 SpoIIE family protein phosphatase [Pistricoccus aurantiacus]
MVSSRHLIGVLDRPGNERDALAETIASDRFAVATAEHFAELPTGIAMLVAHARAVPSQEWAALAARLPTLVVSDSMLDSDLHKAVDAGLVDYITDPLIHGDLLRRMIDKAIENHRLAEAHVRDRERLEELNERLETHLAMLRLDQQAGGHIQRKLLPPCPQWIGGVECDYWLAPSLYLSGDFLDYQRFNDRYSAFYFADVSGHGASSAFVTVLLKYLCNRWLTQWDGEAPEALPAHWLASLNQELLDTGIGKHATLFVGIIDHREHYLHYSLGAQMPPAMLIVDGKLSRLAGQGMPVGLFPQMEYPRLGCALPQNFRLWLCSDGILECLSGNTLEGRLKELEELVQEAGDIAALRERLALEDSSQEEADQDSSRIELPDDVTIMTLSGFADDTA